MIHGAAPEDASFRLLFAANPLPMWLYDAESLQFLEVNDAAVSQYGYTREESFPDACLVVGSLGDPDLPAIEVLADRANVAPGAYLTLDDLRTCLGG